MGADNWRVCPKCNEQHNKAIQESTKNLERAFNNGSLPEYIPIEAKHRELIAQELIETLREDWELRTDIDGKFTIDYACSCNVCGWSFHYKRQEQALKAVQS